MDAERADQQRNAKVDMLLSAGDHAYENGDHYLAHEYWREAVTLDPYNENIWLALFKVLESEDDRIVCLENVIAINPLNVEARRRLRRERGQPDVPIAVDPAVNPLDGIDGQEELVPAGGAPAVRTATRTNPVVTAKPARVRTQAPVDPLPIRTESPVSILARAVMIGIGLGLLGVISGIIASILYWNVVWPF
ncbi:MAG: hypothetical protein IAE80_08115 [Anaerolinea sp.]|mgnify:CR=1 FL=1|nr:hypothetical protein [Anaerolinea sp.]